MLRIVHLNTERTWRGGEAQLMHLARGLRSRGHRQWIAGQPEGALLSKAREEGFETLPLRMAVEWSLPAIVNLSAFLRKEKVQVIHMHTSHACTIGGMAARWAGVPVRIISRRVDFSLRGNWLRRLKYEWGIDRILAVSEGIRTVLLGDGLDPGRVRVVRSGIDFSRFDPPRPPDPFRRELGIGKGVPVIGHVGHFADHKGHRYLVDAAPEILKKFPDARFVLVGDGELFSTVKDQVRRMGLSRPFIFTGFREDIPAILPAFDLFVLPSHLEGLCTSLMDAMAVGLPVVAARAGGIPEVVEDGETGLLVPPRDPKALAEAVVRLLGDKECRRRMGASGRRRVLDRFGAESMVAATERIYEEVLATKEKARVPIA